MARKRKAKKKTQVDDYRHDEQRLNNPPAGMMGSYESGPPESPSTEYSYDPHLDPQLMFDSQLVRERAEKLLAEIEAADDLETARGLARELGRMQKPWLQWTGKAEHTSVEVENVPLYIHERISTQAILRAVRREEVQRGLFGDPELPLHEAVEAYHHEMDWVNRLILGDSLVVMNSLLERERMAGQVQMVYMDPPYGIGYDSNFQPKTDRRTVKDGNDDDLTREPEQIRAYRDTWTLGVHSYLTYLRDRLLLARELLSDTGSIVLQIGDDRVHLVRLLMDEVFGAENAHPLIVFRKKMMPMMAEPGFESTFDIIIWYQKNRADSSRAMNRLFEAKTPEGDKSWNWVELPDGERRRLSRPEVMAHATLPKGSRVVPADLYASSAVPAEAGLLVRVRGESLSTAEGGVLVHDGTGNGPACGGGPPAQERR